MNRNYYNINDLKIVNSENFSQKIKNKSKSKLSKYKTQKTPARDPNRHYPNKKSRQDSESISQQEMKFEDSSKSNTERSSNQSSSIEKSVKKNCKKFEKFGTTEFGDIGGSLVPSKIAIVAIRNLEEPEL
jgi:hypothetical protein